MRIVLALALSATALIAGCVKHSVIEKPCKDDTQHMINAFLEAKDKHDVITIHSGTYNIDQPMPTITQALVFRSDGRAVINYTGVIHF